MDTIDFFGEILAGKLGKEPEIVCNLLKLSIITELGAEVSENLSVADFKKVIMGDLKFRLSLLGIKNLEVVISEFLYKVIKSQSLFTMAAI